MLNTKNRNFIDLIFCKTWVFLLLESSQNLISFSWKLQDNVEVLEMVIIKNDYLGAFLNILL